MKLTVPSSLVTTEWLMANLDHPDLRILDCTILAVSEGENYRIESGFNAWLAGHIPGSTYVDLIAELSVPDSQFSYTLPSAEHFAQAMSRHGVGEGTCVVLYDSDMNVWAARVWWMLKVFGFDNAAVLDGGWHAWQAQGYPLSAGQEPPRPGQFVPTMRPGLIARKEEVVAALDSEDISLVNALSAKKHHDQRIPHSVNVCARSMVDPETHMYLPLSELRERFMAVGALNGARVITYCGAGIVASSDALILTLLGAENVALYDGSLGEWTSDPELPLEIG